MQTAGRETFNLNTPTVVGWIWCHSCTEALLRVALYLYIYRSTNHLTLLSEVTESSNLKESGNITNDLLPPAVGGVGSSDHPEAQLSPPVH